MAEKIDKVDKQEKTATSKNLRYKLVSRLKYAVPLQLKDGETVFIAPHGTISSIDPELLDTELPTGVQKVEFEV